ncbi:MAG: hypothetical protein ACTSSE_09805 [Candidatus Thorarchaeota archaeon]
MINSGECPKCGCQKIAGPHRIFGRSHVAIDLPGMSTATLESLTCTDCGYTELYADRIGLQNIKRDGRFLQRAAESSSRGEPRICAFCGTIVRRDATVCPECGNNF